MSSDPKKDIFSASINGKPIEVERLSKEGSSLEEQDCGGFTPLLTSVIHGNYHVAEYLLKKTLSTESIKSKGTHSGSNILHLMARFGRPWWNIWDNVVREIPSMLPERDKDGLSPYDIADKYKNESERHLHFYEYVASQMSNQIFRLTAEGKMSELSQLFSGNIHFDFSNEGHILLMTAIEKGHKDVVRFLQKIMSGQMLKIPENSKCNVMHAMANYGYSWMDIWRFFYFKYPEMLEQKNAYDETPMEMLQRCKDRSKGHMNLFSFASDLHRTALLISAIEAGHLQEVRRLYEIYDMPDRDIITESGQTPLMLAVFHKHEKITKYLVELPLFVVKISDNNGDNIFHYLCYYEGMWEDIWRSLFAKAAFLLHVKNRAGNTPLKCLLLQSSRVGLNHQTLFKFISRLAKENTNPVFEAAQKGEVAKLKVLHGQGYRLDEQNEVKQTPLMIAIVNGYEDVARFLLNVVSIPSLQLVDMFLQNHLHHMAVSGRPWIDIWHLIAAKSPKSLRQNDCIDKIPIDYLKEKESEGEGHRLLCDIIVWRSIPSRIWTLDQESVNRFVQAVRAKAERSSNIRIMCIGHEGVGKSCLVKQLLGETIDLQTLQSTNLAELYLRRILLDMVTRTTISGPSAHATILEKLRSLVEESQKSTQILDEEHESIVVPTVEHKCESGLRDTHQILEETTQKTSGNEPVHQNIQQKDSEKTRLKTSETFREKTSEISERKTGVLRRLFSSLRKKKRPERVKTKDDDYDIPVVESKTPDTEKNQTGIPEDRLTGFQKYVIDSVLHKEPKLIHKSQAFVTIYDFGGEEVFYNSHHSFLTSDSIYLLVFAVTNDEKEGIERIVFWLRSIATYARDEKESRRGTPPILLIGSHMDLLQGTGDEKQKQFNSILEKVKAVPGMQSIMESHVKGIFPIANLNDSNRNEEIFQKIWDTVVDVAPLQSQWKKLVPGKWLLLEHELLQKKEAGLKVMTIEEVQELDRTLALPLRDIQDIKLFLRYLHLTGVMLAFDVESENPIIVLDAQWVVDAFKCLITASKFVEELGNTEMDEWNEYVTSGILFLRVLKMLFRRYPEKKFLNHLKILLPAMERLGLLVKPIPKDDNDTVDFYIVPSMLQKTGQDGMDKVLGGSSTINSCALCIQFKNPFIPQAVWDKFIAACIHRFQPYQMPGKESFSQFQRGSAFFVINCHWNMTLQCKNNLMKITLFREPPKHQEDLDRIPNAYQIRLVLEGILQQILIMNQQGHLKFDYYLHCDYRIRQDDIMVSVNDLIRASSLDCYVTDEQGRQRVSITRQDYDFWFQDMIKDPLQQDIDVGLNRRPNYRELGRIAKLIYGSHHMFFVELGLSDSEISQVRHGSNHLSFRSQVTKIFIKWMDPRGENATLQQIAVAMDTLGMDKQAMMEELERMQDSGKNLGEILPPEQSERKLLEREIDTIVEFIDDSYFNLFLEIGLTPQTIAKSEMNYRGDVTRIFKDLLEKWIQSGATLGCLSSAMKECNMAAYDLSVKLASKMKTM